MSGNSPVGISGCVVPVARDQSIKPVPGLVVWTIATLVPSGEGAGMRPLAISTVRFEPSAAMVSIRLA
jgi:hypothetical protein